MDKKKSNLIEIAYDNNGGGKEKEISLERKDRFYRILTPEESFRMLCYAFHGKGPGERKVEKRMKKQEQKLKQMKDAPLLFVEKCGKPKLGCNLLTLCFLAGMRNQQSNQVVLSLRKGNQEEAWNPCLVMERLELVWASSASQNQAIWIFGRNPKLFFP